MEGKMVGESAT